MCEFTALGHQVDVRADVALAFPFLQIATSARMSARGPDSGDGRQTRPTLDKINLKNACRTVKLNSKAPHTVNYIGLVGLA